MNPENINLLFVDDYRSDGIKELARAMRDRGILYELAANLMVPLVPDNAILIPVPSHDGRPGMAAELAECLSRYTGAPMASLLTCSPHPSSYELKNSGQVLHERDIMFRLLEPVPQGYVPVIVDNVTASGNTAIAALKAAGADTIITFADDAQAMGRRPELNEARRLVNDRRSRMSEVSLYTWPHNPDKTFIRTRIDGNPQISKPISRRLAVLGKVVHHSRYEQILNTVIAERYYADELTQPIDRTCLLNHRR